MFHEALLEETPREAPPNGALQCSCGYFAKHLYREFLSESRVFPKASLEEIPRETSLNGALNSSFKVLIHTCISKGKLQVLCKDPKNSEIFIYRHLDDLKTHASVTLVLLKWMYNSQSHLL